MFDNFIGALVIAFILHLVGVDRVLIQGIYDLTGYQLTQSAYYVAFALLGVASGLFWKG